MAAILYVKVSDKKKRIDLGIDDCGEVGSFSISEATYLSLGCLPRGSEIDADTVSLIKAEDEVYRATKKAVGYLAASDRSRFSLKMKLRQAGFSSEAAHSAVEYCILRGYIDEARQLERLVEKEANYSLRGKYYIKRKLASKGYALSDIDRAIRDLLERGEIDFDANFELLKEKKDASEPEEINSLKYKFGYKI